MLLLGLVETSLELIPEDQLRHPSVLRLAKTRGKPPSQLLLDEATLPQVVAGLSEPAKHGRPDIAHRSLLLALDSVLARTGHLQVFVHTVTDHVITIKPETRLPRREPRFVGLIEQLLHTGCVPQSGSPLLELYSGSLDQYLHEITPTRTYLLTHTGTPMTPPEFTQILAGEPRPLVLVGGFAHGMLSPRITQLASEKVSLHPDPLPTSTVVGIIVHNLETILKVQE
jgi:rRNA small subunit pseudouridine methyltransferase Nep1